MIETPRTLHEQLVWETALRGSTEDVTLLKWRGPTKEPFLTLWEDGWRKWRLRHESAAGVVTVIHFWAQPDPDNPEQPAGGRLHLKIKE